MSLPTHYRVLLVEDNPDTVFTVSGGLAMRTEVKYDVEAVDRLSAAIARLSQGGIDAVVLDLTLPDAHGVEAVEQVVAAAPDVGIVVLSGLPDMEEPAKAAGADDFLAKPAEPRDLSIKLQWTVAYRKLREQKHAIEDDLARLGNVIVALREKEPT